MVDSLLDRIGNTLRTAGSGIGDILAAGGQAYAPPDMDLTRNQQMGLLGSRLGDMMVGPRGEMTNNTPTYLQDIRNNQTRLDVTAAIQADPDLTPAEKQSLLSLPTSNQIEFMQNKMETKYAPSGLLQAPSSVRTFNFFRGLNPNQELTPAEEQQMFMSLLRAGQTYDTGRETGVLDPLTGLPSSRIPLEIPIGQSPEEEAAVARAVGDEEVSTAQQIARDAAEIDRETALGERDIERLDDFNLDKNAFNQNLVDIDLLIQKGEEILAHPGFDMAFGATSNITGLTGSLNIYGGQDAQNLVQTFKDNEFAEMIGRMREQSETGGAVGQVSEKEGERFENMLGDLRFSSSEEQARSNLERIIRELENSKNLYTLSMQNEYKDLSESEGLFIEGYEATIGRAGAFSDVGNLTQRQQLTLERGGELSDAEYDLLSDEELQRIVDIQERLRIR